MTRPNSIEIALKSPLIQKILIRMWFGQGRKVGHH